MEEVKVKSPSETTLLKIEVNDPGSGDNQHDPLLSLAQQAPSTSSPVTPHRAAGGETGERSLEPAHTEPALLKKLDISALPVADRVQYDDIDKYRNPEVPPSVCTVLGIQ